MRSSRLPKSYQILPESVDFKIRGFIRHGAPNAKTLALRQRDCTRWFDEFVNRLVDAMGRKFLPVCRVGIGEFKFVLGEQFADVRLSLLERMKFVPTVIRNRHSWKDFEVFSEGDYHSGKYSRKEQKKIAGRDYGEMMRHLGLKGILAPILTYGDVPWQERFFPGFARWMDENGIVLTDVNYYPCYFVYAALTGDRRGELLKNRRILVVNGAEGEKRKRIEQNLMVEGASDVIWCPISLTRSLFDTPDFLSFAGKADIAMVGAGLGKPNILTRMEPLNIPCVDAGYIIEVWADSRNKWRRPYCALNNYPFCRDLEEK